MALPKPHIITPDSALGGIQLEKSLRFNSGDSTYLERTPSSAGNRKTNTLSFWVKLGKTGVSDSGTVASCNSSNSDSNNISVVIRDTSVRIVGYYNNFRITNRILRDPTSWYHIVLVIDTTQASADNRIKIYVNGVQETSFSTSGNVSQNANLGFAQASTTRVGSRSNDGNGSYFDGYLTEVNFIDGQAYDPSYFGFTDAQTGQWRPKKYGGTYGTTGFYLDFRDSSSAAALGYDRSGNGNNFTPNNFSVTAGVDNDSVSDTPTNNFCTLNPSSNGTGAAPFDGNLKFNTTASATGTMLSTVEVSSGKWYCEVKVTFGSNNGALGIRSITQSDINSNTLGNQTLDYAYRGNGQKFNSNTKSSYGNSYTTDDVIGIALDLDSGTIKFLKNNSDEGIAFTGISGTFVFAVGDDNTSSTFQGTFNFGQQAFTYTPPTGYRTLNSRNLATSSTAEIIKPQRHFDTLIWDGNSTQDRNITGLEFKPDMVWIKSRSHATYGGGLSYHHLIWDVLRGVGSNTIGASSRKELTVNQNYEEGRGANYTDYYGHVSSFNEDGFQLDFVSGQPPFYVNQTSRTYVAWCWKAGGAGVSNSDGSIASTVSANTEAGFSIVTYTGNATSGATVGHGLGVAPDLIIVKNRDTARNWTIFNSASGATKFLLLNTTNADQTATSVWNDTAPTSSVFSVGTSQNINYAEDYVAYCWAGIPGYSKIGSYTGNGSANGPFIHLGFRPAWFMQKKVSGSGNWYIFDNKRSGFNVDNDMLSPNLTDAEYDGQTYPRLDFVSNGIKWVDAGSSVHNASGATYIYMAFAERPSGTIFGVDANAR